MEDYKVRLDVYNGPFDLLLFLIRRNELDIYDIPIAVITRQYCEYVDCLRQVDPDTAAEFVVLATVLMEIKSRMLLPTPPAEDGQPEELGDPRMELVRQLLEYKKFKDASFELGRAAAEQSARWPRGPLLALASHPKEYDLDEVQVWDLVSTFNHLMMAIGRDRVTHDVVFDDTPIALHAADILDRLSREGDLPFEAIFAGRTRAEMIGLFLALLELIRQWRVRVEQPDVFGPIRVVLLSAEPITIGSEWEYRPAAAEGAVEPESIGGRESRAEAADEAASAGEEQDEEEDELIRKLEAIRTDVDIDAGSAPGAPPEGGNRDSNDGDGKS